MNLLIVCNVLTRKHALDFVEVPVGDAWHVIDLFSRPPHVIVLAVRTVDTEPETVVEALAQESALPGTASLSFVKASTVLPGDPTRLLMSVAH